MHALAPEASKLKAEAPQTVSGAPQTISGTPQTISGMLLPLARPDACIAAAQCGHAVPVAERGRLVARA